MEGIIGANHVMQAHAGDVILAVSLELSAAQWKVALHDGLRERPAVHAVGAPQAELRLQSVLELIGQHKHKWALPTHVRVVVSYEAGQDGFWILRALSSRGIECYMVDAASIPVQRHKRRAKTDRLDAIKLVTNLRAWLHGELDRMRVVRAPSVQDEAVRHLIRDRGQLHKEVLQHRERMRKLLVTLGCWDEVDHRSFARRLATGQLTCHDGTALPAPVRERISYLRRLRGVGHIGASRLVLELFWRQFSNRRQLGACVGLVPQPYDSGESHVDQGISNQGNRRGRTQLVEMDWGWLRYQPDSTLARWFNERTQSTGPNRRARRIAIVALARRLVIALWRYLKDGLIPEGAQFKPA